MSSPRMCSRVMVALALLSSAGRAAADRRLSLDEALGLARSHNRDLRQARLRVEQAHAAVLTARAALMPTAALQGKYTHNYREVALPFKEDPNLPPVMIVIQKGEQLDLALNVAVPLVVPFAYKSIQAAKASEEAGRANLVVNDAAVLFATAQTYYACAGADELTEARRHAVLVAKKAIDNAKARLEAGVVNRVEVTRAELQLVRTEQALVEAEDVRASSYRALGTLIDMHEPVQVVPAAPPAERQEEVKQLTDMALRLRPEFRALDATIENSRLVAETNLWRWAPTLSAFGTVRTFNYGGFAGDKYFWALGLQLDWTIYDGGLRDVARQLAEAQRRESEVKRELLQDQVRDDVYNAERQLRTKRRALETAQRSAALSHETLDLVQVQHDAGTATQLDLLLAQDNLVAAEVAQAQARFDLSLGALQLERLSGQFPNNRAPQ